MSGESALAPTSHGAAGPQRIPFRDRQRNLRTRTRRRANQRALTTVDPAAVRNPLEREEQARSRWLSRWALVALLSIGLHATIFGVASLLPRTVVERFTERPPLEIEVVAAHPPQPAPEPVRPPPPAPKPPPPPPPRLVKPPPKLAAVELPPTLEPPPDPVETPRPPPPPTTAPVRRIVGLSLESTVSGGGPAFAVGNTRMGQTAAVAEDPGSVVPLPGMPAPPAKRVSVKPDYPAALKAQHIQGDVRLEVVVDTTGKVSKVTVISSSGFDELDQAAVAAAWREQYDPSPVPHLIPFTTYFRLH